MSLSIEELLEPVPHRRNRLCVKGTSTTVHRIARWWRTGMTADEIAADYEHLSLAGVHAALAYYFANRERIDAEIDAEIEEERRLVSEHSRLKRLPEKEAA
ncbi:MAG TPA: DUF433 domain-containing protein [Pyrinomonadaceae bacterium]|nr:DUF433 domain-containing protein [Pyrinomonadaceae bacterium]